MTKQDAVAYAASLAATPGHGDTAWVYYNKSNGYYVSDFPPRNHKSGKLQARVFAYVQEHVEA